MSARTAIASSIRVGGASTGRGRIAGDFDASLAQHPEPRAGASRLPARRALSSRSRAGATLLELMVALSILAIAAAVAVPALRRSAEVPVTERSRIAAARRQALEQGHAVTLTLRDSAGTRLVTAFPDGHVAADTALALDPASGKPRAGR